MAFPDTWTDRSATLDQWDDIGREYGLHELQLRALDKNHRLPQAVESDDWLVVNFLAPRIRNGVLKYDRLSALVNKKHVVTIHEPDAPIMDELRERLALRRHIEDSPTGVLALVADVVTECFVPVLDYVDDIVDKVEDTIIKRPTDKQLRQLFRYKNLLVDLRRVVLPTTAVLDALADGRYDMVDPKYAMYLRDSYNYSWRAREQIDTLRDMLSSALDTYLTMASNKMNDVMKRLTLVATIFMPISFLAGVGGMNFTHMPFSSDVLFFVLLGLMVAVPVVMIAYFYKKGWL